MLFQQLREIVWKCNLELPKNDLVKLTSGNVSGRDPESGLVVIKPSGVIWEELTPENMVVVDLEGNVVEGDLNPSTDTDTHLYVYQHRPDVFGIVHTHSPYASSFAALGEPIPTAEELFGLTPALEPAVPNPFHESATFSYTIPYDSPVKISLFDALGREIVTEQTELRKAGSYSFVIDGTQLPGGIYFCRLTTGQLSQTRSVLHMR